ncbi:MAG: cohesin domain-containing protein [Candidatus Acidiferrales bacterium]
MPQRHLAAAALCGLLVFAAGCSKGNPDFTAGKKAEAIQDYDTALAAYNRALKADPNNSLYRIRAEQMRFEDAQAHIEQGQKIREKGDLQMALAEFRNAQEIDPSSPAAEQEVQNTLALISAKQAAEAAPPAQPLSADNEEHLLTGPPQLKPLSPVPINLKMVNDSKAAFETIGKLAGVTVIFDPDFVGKRIPVELNNVTLEQALDIVAIESKAYWKPITSNIIFVTNDQTQKRHDYEPEVIRTFYLANTLEPNDLTEISTALRSLFDLRHVSQINAENAIVIRDTPDKVMLAAKVIDDIDKAKPEVIIQVAVLTANRDRTRDLGINPGTSASLTFSPPTTSTSSSSSTTSATSMALNALKHISTADYQITLPSATANALLTDSSTHIIQNPEIRIVDGQQAKLKIGERVPVATGSFQAGVGVGTTSGAGIVNPLVNTQFTYLDVGVNVDVTPRIHPNGDVSMKLMIEVSSVAGTSNIGGINQPIIAQQHIEHEVRLKDGEVNVLGGLIQQTQTNTMTGWPGLQKIPWLRYFFSDSTSTNNDDELLIVLIPHVVRLPAITAENLQSLYSGTDTNPAVLLESDVQAPPVTPPAPPLTPAAGTAAAPPPQAAQTARLRFDPPQVTLKPGDEKTIAIVVEGMQDLFSTPMLLQYDPKVISVEDIHDGGFLSGGTQAIAFVQRVDQEHGQAIISATRMPNTPGVSGSGTLMGIQIKALAPGQTKLSIVQVNARDSQQRSIPVVTGEVAIQVQGQ